MTYITPYTETVTRHAYGERGVRDIEPPVTSRDVTMCRYPNGSTSQNHANSAHQPALWDWKFCIWRTDTDCMRLSRGV